MGAGCFREALERKNALRGESRGLGYNVSAFLRGPGERNGARAQEGPFGWRSDSRDEMTLQLEELEKTQTLELEQKLLNIIDDAWTLLMSCRKDTSFQAKSMAMGYGMLSVLHAATQESKGKCCPRFLFC